jgi:hypothetical protein
MPWENVGKARDPGSTNIPVRLRGSGCRSPLSDLVGASRARVRLLAPASKRPHLLEELSMD